MNASIKLGSGTYRRVPSLASVRSEHPDCWSWPDEREVRAEALTVCKQLHAEGVRYPTVHVVIDGHGDWGVTSDERYARLHVAHASFTFDPDVPEDAHEIGETMDGLRLKALEKWEERYAD